MLIGVLGDVGTEISELLERDDDEDDGLVAALGDEAGLGLGLPKNAIFKLKLAKLNFCVSSTGACSLAWVAVL
jgi:hypothetical protein